MLLGKDIIKFITENHLEDSVVCADVIEYLDGDHNIEQKNVSHVTMQETWVDVPYTDKLGRKRTKKESGTPIIKIVI